MWYIAQCFAMNRDRGWPPENFTPKTKEKFFQWVSVGVSVIISLKCGMSILYYSFHSIFVIIYSCYSPHISSQWSNFARIEEDRNPMLRYISLLYIVYIKPSSVSPPAVAKVCRINLRWPLPTHKIYFLFSRLSLFFVTVLHFVFSGVL